MKHSAGRLTAQPASNPASSNEIDHMLSREDEILPSSGFLASVMDAVQREAAVPPPIPFPWKRAVPGLAAACFALVLVLVVGFMVSGQSGHATLPQPGPVGSLIPPILSGGMGGGIESAAIWTAMSLLLAWVSVKLSMRLAVGRV